MSNDSQTHELESEQETITEYIYDTVIEPLEEIVEEPEHTVVLEVVYETPDFLSEEVFEKEEEPLITFEEEEDLFPKPLFKKEETVSIPEKYSLTPVPEEEDEEETVSIPEEEPTPKPKLPPKPIPKPKLPTVIEEKPVSSSEELASILEESIPAPVIEKKDEPQSSEKIKRKYGLKISRIPKEKHTPLKLKAKPQTHIQLPPKVDLRPKLPTPYDQGTLGSCTANALCAAFQFEDPSFMGSRLFIYYNERKTEGTIEEDTGAQLQDGIDTMKNYGVCSESDWPYDITKFTQKPSSTCYSDALKHHIINAYNINNDINSMKNCLASGYPFVVGIMIFESFESQLVAQSGMVSMPTQDEECLGGHAVLVCGYEDATQRWILRNSWGTKWGDNGYFYLPYVYLLDSSLCSDLWYISRVEVENKQNTKPVNKLEAIINRLRASLPMIN